MLTWINKKSTKSGCQVPELETGESEHKGGQ